MARRAFLLLCELLFLTGCLYHAREKADETVCALAARPYDLLPIQPEEGKGTAIVTPAKKVEGTPTPAQDVQTTAYMQREKNPDQPETKQRLEPKIPPEIPG